MKLMKWLQCASTVCWLEHQRVWPCVQNPSWSHPEWGAICWYLTSVAWMHWEWFWVLWPARNSRIKALMPRISQLLITNFICLIQKNWVGRIPGIQNPTSSIPPCLSSCQSKNFSPLLSKMASGQRIGLMARCITGGLYIREHDIIICYFLHHWKCEFYCNYLLNIHFLL